MADEDLDAIGLHALVEQMQDVALPAERLEQALQSLYVGDLVQPHEIRFAGHDELGRRLRFREHLLRHLDRLDHQRIHRGARSLELGEQQLADFRQAAAAAIVVQIIAGTLELVGTEISRNVENFVLDLAIIDYEDGEHSMARQRQKLDLPQRGLRAARHRDDPGEARDRRKQVRYGQRERLRIARRIAHALAEAQELFAFRRRELDQRVDEEAIALDRRNASGRSVRRFDEPELFEVGDDVANRRRAQVQARLARQRARAYRLSVANVLLDEKTQQNLRALVQYVSGFVARHRPSCDNVEPAFLATSTLTTGSRLCQESKPCRVSSRPSRSGGASGNAA